MQLLCVELKHCVGNSPSLLKPLWKTVHETSGLRSQVSYFFFLVLWWGSDVHLFVVKLKAVTSLNRMLKGLEPSIETAWFHDSAVVPFQVLWCSRSAWTLCCVAGLRGVTVPGHKVCSWLVTWTRYAISLVWHSLFCGQDPYPLVAELGHRRV